MRSSRIRRRRISRYIRRSSPSGSVATVAGARRHSSSSARRRPKTVSSEPAMGSVMRAGEDTREHAESVLVHKPIRDRDGLARARHLKANLLHGFEGLAPENRLCVCEINTVDAGDHVAGLKPKLREKIHARA